LRENNFININYMSLVKNIAVKLKRLNLCMEV